MGYHIEEYLSAEKIAARVREIGANISKNYEGKEIVLLCVLKGSFMFFADLVREITVPLSVDFLTLSSYGAGTESSGKVQLVQESKMSLEGKHVIIVEDIVDSGNTLSFLLGLLKEKNLASLEICSLLSKPSRRVVDIPLNPEYIGFEIPDTFVVGYGLDYDQKYRELPYVGQVVFDEEE